MTGDSKEERLFFFEPRRECCAGIFEGLSTGSVLARIGGLGPREEFCEIFCVPSIWAALDGCDVGNKVKLDRAGDVARR